MAYNGYDLDFKPKTKANTVIITIYNPVWKEKNKGGYEDIDKRKKRGSQKVRTLINSGTR